MDEDIADALLQEEDEWKVSGDGCTAWETVLTILPLPHSGLIVMLILPWILTNKYETLPDKWRIWLQFIVEFPFLNLIFLANISFLFDYVEQLNMSLVYLLLTVIIVAYASSQKTYQTTPDSDRSLWKILDQQMYPSTELPFVTTYRSCTYIATVMCILAVDFKTFPRKLAKTDKKGFSLMDVGTGAFIFSQGLVSTEARKGDKHIKTTLQSVLLQCVPLLVLAFIRLFLVFITGYHHAVSEYGLHWNFFFTLCGTKLLSGLLLLFVDPSRSWLLSLFTIVIQDYLLQLGMGSWVLNSELPRNDLITANKEGIGSLIGYLAIHFAGIAWGRFYFQTMYSTVRDWLRLFLVQIAVSASLWTATMYLVFYYEEVSRKEANFTYFLWMVTYNGVLLCVMMCIDLVLVIVQNCGKGTYDKVPYSVLWKAINYNGLLFFLLGNIFTGVVNLSMKTRSASNPIAFLILSVYTLLLSFIIVLLYQMKIKLKL